MNIKMHTKRYHDLIENLKHNNCAKYHFKKKSIGKACKKYVLFEENSILNKELFKSIF